MWNWTQPDALVKFCGENNIRIMGHTLVWHQQTNPWFFQNATREVVLQRLFAIFIKHRDIINRVTFWGLNDRRSWRSGQNPLIFDSENNTEPALQAILSVAVR